MLHSFFYPGKALALRSMNRIEQANAKLLAEKKELEESLKKLRKEKRAYEYFKRILLEEGTKIHMATDSKNGKFTLISQSIPDKQDGRDRLGYVKVWMSERDWNGESPPKPACDLTYKRHFRRTDPDDFGSEIEDYLEIGDITSRVCHEGAGSLAMDTLLKICKQEEYVEIMGDLSCNDIDDHEERLIPYYNKYDFEIIVRNDNSNVYADISKRLI